LHYEKLADGTVKCIEEEIPFDVPKGWLWARIFSIADDLPYGTAKKSEKEGKLVVLRMGNIQSGEIDYNDLVYSSDEEDIARYSLIPGDLLFNRTNSAEWVGKTAIYRGDVPCIYAGYLIRVRTHINAEYLNAVMNSGYAKDYCNSVKTDGVNQSNINAQKLGAFLVPIPPIKEQLRIDAYIAKALPHVQAIGQNKADIAALVSLTKSKILDLAVHGQLVPHNPNDEPASVLLDRIRAEKKELVKQGIIKQDKRESGIFLGEDNSYYEKVGEAVSCIDELIPFELPEGWAWVRGYSCFSGMESKRPAGVDFDYIDIDSIDNRNHVITEPKHMAVHDAPSRASRAVRAGSVLFSLVRPYLQNIAYIPEEYSSCIASTGFYVCNSSGALIPEFMFYLMLSPYVVNGLNQFMKGDNSPSISKDDIENWLYPIPPIAEQKRIVIHVQKALEQTSLIASSLS
jgi:hypothetical protein